MKKKTMLVLLPLLMAGCSGRDDLSDAYGNFETREYLISAEGNGKILQLDLEEGDILSAGQAIGYIDTLHLHLQREQLKAKIKAIRAQKSGVSAQIEVHNAQRRTLLVEKKRLEKLLEDDAATGKQMDDLNGQLNTLEQQIRATRSRYETIDSEILAMEAQIRIVEDQIRRNLIVNPLEGTVLEKFAETYEMAIPGKAIYKIANLESMNIRVYVSGSQLAGITLGQPVAVLIDHGEGRLDAMEGRVSWISDRAEFTPKIIQTREERVNLVYAVKVEVPNDGRLKIGMPGEVNFQALSNE